MRSIILAFFLVVVLAVASPARACDYGGDCYCEGYGGGYGGGYRYPYGGYGYPYGGYGRPFGYSPYGYGGYGYQLYNPRKLFRENAQTFRLRKPDGTIIEMER